MEIKKGHKRYNATKGIWEYYDGTKWILFKTGLMNGGFVPDNKDENSGYICYPYRKKD